jgi:hypothetical protein
MNGSPSLKSAAAARSNGKSVDSSNAQSTSLGSNASVIKLPFNDEPLHTCFLRRCDKPSNRIHLSLPNFRFLTEPSGNFFERCQIGAVWKVAVIVEIRNHVG